MRSHLGVSWGGAPAHRGTKKAFGSVLGKHIQGSCTLQLQWRLSKVCKYLQTFLSESELGGPLNTEPGEECESE